MTRPIAFVGVIGMLIASGVTVVDVLLRWFANSGVTALNEIISMTFAVAVTACIPAGLATGVGISIDAIERSLSSRTASWLKCFGALTLLAFFVLLSWRTAIHASNLTEQGRTTVVLGLPQGPFIWATTILLGISTLVQGVVSLGLIVAHLKRPVSREPRTVADVIVWFTLIVLALLALAAIFYFEPVSRWANDHPATTVIFGLLLLWVCLLGLIPLAAAMGLIGLVGTGFLIGFEPAFSVFSTEVVGFITNYQVATLPLFLMMGGFAAMAGVSDDVYRLAQAAVGRFRGGLGIATIGGCAGFGAVTGSSLATVATFGRVSLPQMQSRNYAPQFSAGCVAAGGTLGALLPPSGPLILFALLTEASIGQLFVAAIVPGLIAVALYTITIVVMVRLKPHLVPPSEKTDATELRAAVKQCSAVVLLFGTVVGGMYTGVFTSTEAAAVGAFGAFVIALVRGKFRAETFWSVISETTASISLIYTIIFGVLIFSFFIGVSGLPEQTTAFVSNLNLPPLVIIGIILVFFILLGCVMDSIGIMFITVPIVTPVILLMGYDLVWWGIINLVIVELGLITPPFGLHLFVLKSMMPKLPLMRLYEGVLPFCLADSLKLLLLVMFPILILWLPSTMTP